MNNEIYNKKQILKLSKHQLIKKCEISLLIDQKWYVFVLIQMNKMGQINKL